MLPMADYMSPWMWWVFVKTKKENQLQQYQTIWHNCRAI